MNLGKVLSAVLNTATALVFTAPLIAQAGTQIRLLKGNYTTQDVAKSISLLSAPAHGDYVVQFKNPVTETEKAELKAVGAQVFRYLPDDALIVSGNITALQNYASGNDKVNAIVPYRADWKMSPTLPTISVFSRGHQAAILITLFNSPSVDQTRKSVVSSIQKIDPQAQILGEEGRSISVMMDLSQVPSVAALSGIEFVEQVQKYSTLEIQLLDNGDGKKPNDPNKPGAPVDPIKEPPVPVQAPGNYSDLTGYETGTKVLKMDSAWAQGFSGTGQIVAMADTGLDTGNLTPLSNDFQGAIHSSHQFGLWSRDWSDPMGHGTHVAGSVLGRGTASGGKLKGAAFDAQLIVEGLWSPMLANLTVPPELDTLFTPAYDEGARIHTNSWGAAAGFGSYDSMAQKVDQFMWDHPDFLILFAAGNSGTDHSAKGKIDPNSIGSPGTAKNCVTVGASKNLVSKGGIQKKISELRAAATEWPAEPISSSKLSDRIDGMAMFSSRGPTQDNRIKPDVVAPGTNILSVHSHVKDADLLWGAYNDDYVWSGGTSMATPLAAGFATVTREILVKKHNIASPSAALMKAVMMHTAFDMYPGQYGAGTPTQELDHRPNNDEGYGRLDMDKIVNLGSATRLFDQVDGVAQGETFEQVVNLKQGQSLSANLVYTDAPGTPSAGQALVNNLDLIVVTPDGKELGSHDTVNNAEVLELNNLAPGTYKVQVRGINVPMGKNGKQPFALVYTAI
jgi:serine protease AprX